MEVTILWISQKWIGIHIMRARNDVDIVCPAVLPDTIVVAEHETRVVVFGKDKARGIPGNHVVMHDHLAFARCLDDRAAGRGIVHDRVVGDVSDALDTHQRAALLRRRVAGDDVVLDLGNRVCRG